ncbi:MAG: hypothetical protein KC996_10025 [Phycisphaerales bacterium]|nr:hypothetical protein [Phycisphaerales bacterium]
MLDKLLEGQKDNLIGMLTSKLGVSDDQAGGFLNKLLPMIEGLLGKGKIDPSALLKGDVSSLKSGLDLDVLGKALGGGKEKAEQGIETVAGPIAEKLNGLDNPMDMLKGVMGGDAEGLLKKGLGKIFG